MKRFLKEYGPALLTGLLLAWSFPGLHFFVLAWVALIPLLYQCREATPQVCAKRFLLAGWLFHSLTLQWLAVNVFWAGGMALMAHQLLSLYLSVYWALLGAAWAWMRNRLPERMHIGLFPALWVVMEWIQATWFTGFGWCALGYTQAIDLPLAQLAALGGVTLLSALIVTVNVALLYAWTRTGRRLVYWGVVALLLAVGHMGGYLLLREANYDTHPYKVGLYQSNYGQEMKWDIDYLEDMVSRAAWQSKQLAELKPYDLMIWPEGLITTAYEDPLIYQWIADTTLSSQAPLYTGLMRRAEDGRFYNSSSLFNVEGKATGFYDKVHLAPFGEYVPFGKLFPFVRSAVPIDTAFGEGQAVLDCGKRKFGPLICFEVLFSDMAQELRRQDADYLVVITNLAWFGKSNAITQELEIARMRAIETRLPLVHSSNTGISGVFDSWGRFTPVPSFFSMGRFVDDYYSKSPRRQIMERAAGTLPVPAPGGGRLPGGIRLFPWIALLLLLAYGIWIFLNRKVVEEEIQAAGEAEEEKEEAIAFSDDEGWVEDTPQEEFQI